MSYEVTHDKSDFKQELLSLKFIAIRHIKNISDICISDFSDGYWKKSPVRIGGGTSFSEEWKTDNKLAYINAIDFLYDLMLPYFIEDKENKAGIAIDAILQKETDAFKDFKGDAKGWNREKVKYRRQILRELFLFMYRTNFFDGEEFYSN